MATLAVPLALEQRCRRAERAEQTSQVVGERDGHADWWSVGKAGDVRQSAHGRRWRPEASLVAVRPVLAVAGDTYQHDIGIGGLERLVADVPTLESAGAEVLEDEVAAFDELQKQLAAARDTQIQSHRAFVTTKHRPIQRTVGEHRRDIAQAVALARHLDLDHLGAEVG